MSDELEMSARIAGTAESWHGSENIISPEDAKDLDKVRAAGGLLWEAKGFANFNLTEEGEVMPTQTITVRRSTDNAVLGTHSEDYKIHQPAEVLQPYHDLIVSDGRFRWDFVTSLRGGKMITACAVMEEEAEIVSEKHKAYLMATTSFDGSHPTTLGATLVRIVCANTLRMAMTDKMTKKLRFKHKRTLPGVDTIHRQLEGALSQIEIYRTFAEGISLHRMSKDAAVTFLRESIFKPETVTKKDLRGVEFQTLTEPSTRAQNRMEAIEKAFEITQGEIGSDVTLWTVWNSMTRFADHEMIARMTKGREAAGETEQSVSLENKLFGSGDKFKQDNLSRVLDLMAA